MNYVLMGITCVVFVYILYRMGKSHTKECNDDITYNYRPKSHLQIQPSSQANIF